MKYKLVIPKVLPDFMTGQELKDVLTAQGFSIPRLKLTQRPLPPQPDKVLFPQNTIAGQNEWKRIAALRRPIVAENKITKAKFVSDMATLVAKLTGMFQIATYVFTGGHNPNGTKIWAYRIVPDPAYSFRQVASRLTKLESAEVIDFIAFKHFG